MTDAATEHVSPAGMDAIAYAHNLADMGAGSAASVRVVRRRVVGLPLAGVQGAPQWLVTFADLVALLVAFFVMMLSMSAFDSDALSRQPDLAPGTSAAARAVASPVAAADTDAGAAARYLALVIADKVSRLDVAGNVDLRTIPGGALVTLPRSILDGGPASAEFGAVVARVAAGAPGRLMLYAPAPSGGDAAWREALEDVRRVYVASGETAAGIGIAGWLAADRVAVAISDRRVRRGGAS